MIDTTVSDGCLEIVLQRPARANALSQEMVQALTEAIDAGSSPDVRYIVISAEGKHFCAGFDLASDEDSVLNLRFIQLERLLAKVAYAPVPTIACVKGVAVGAGADLVAACTFRLGTPEVSLRFPGPRFGVVLGTSRLRTLVGAEWATRLLLLQEEVQGGEEALRIGLLSHMVRSESALADAARHIGERLTMVDAETQYAILQLVRLGDATRELGELCLSTSRPGLRERLTDYASARRA